MTTALEYALRRWPHARRCAAVDQRGRFLCPYPLDPANGDHPWHMACSPEAQRAEAAARLATARRGVEVARAAIAAKGSAA